MKRFLFFIILLIFISLISINTTLSQEITPTPWCIKIASEDNIFSIQCPIEPSATNTPTPTTEVVPTQEVFPTPVSTSTPVPNTKVCKLRANEFNINIRSGHNTYAAIVGLWEVGQDKTFSEFYEDRNYLWARSNLGWSVVRDIPADTWWTSGVEFYSDICKRVDGWPEGLEPPLAFAEWVPPDNPRGIHLYIGANCNLLLTKMNDYGIIKGITGTDACIKLIHMSFPDKFFVWRNWIRAGHVGDGPPGWGSGDPIEVANDWWNREYSTWLSLGMIQSNRNDFENDVIDLFEYRNELIFVGNWEIQFDLQILKLATEQKICLGAFSDGYGNPTLAQFNTRQPVLEYMLQTECQPGRHHVIATHSYSKYDSGMWYFGRWQTFRKTLEDAYGPMYNALYWIFTELGVPNTEGNYDGRGNPDCPKALVELQIIDKIYRPDNQKFNEVIGYTIFAMGISDTWLDWGKCLQ